MVPVDAKWGKSQGSDNGAAELHGSLGPVGHHLSWIIISYHHVSSHHAKILPQKRLRSCHRKDTCYCVTFLWTFGSSLTWQSVWSRWKEELKVESLLDVGTARPAKIALKTVIHLIHLASSLGNQWLANRKGLYDKIYRLNTFSYFFTAMAPFAGPDELVRRLERLEKVVEDRPRQALQPDSSIDFSDLDIWWSLMIFDVYMHLNNHESCDMPAGLSLWKFRWCHFPVCLEVRRSISIILLSISTAANGPLRLQWSIISAFAHPPFTQAYNIPYVFYIMYTSHTCRCP